MSRRRSTFSYPGVCVYADMLALPMKPRPSDDSILAYPILEVSYTKPVSSGWEYGYIAHRIWHAKGLEHFVVYLLLHS